MGILDDLFGKKGEEKMFEPILTPGMTKEEADQALADNPIEPGNDSQADTGLDSVVSGLFQTVFGKDNSNKGQLGGGTSQFGDFNLDSFLEGSLASERGKDADGTAKAIGGLIKMIGI